MTNEERDIIAAFIARVSGAQAPQAQSTWGGASVPATQQAPALPPVDPEADAFITEQFQKYPGARYRITQLAFVEEHALIEAQNRIKRLEWELQQAQQAAQQQAGQQGQSHGGFFSGLFGGGRSQSAPRPAWGPGGAPPNYQYQQSAPPPSPQYPPGYQPGVFQRSGSGFLGSALTTAAGVAGGMLAADAIRDMFSPRESLGGLGAGGGAGVLGGPWGGADAAAPTDPGYVDQGSWSVPDPSAAPPDQGSTDQGSWDQGGADQSGWTDPANDPNAGGWDQGGGGWDQGGGGSDDDSLI